MDTGPPPEFSLPANQLAIRRAAAALCVAQNWPVLHELSLPNGRRCDLLALKPDGGFVCIEVKSGPRDFLADAKWGDYRAFSDELFFAVDAAFPLSLLPADVGVMVACTATGGEAVMLRAAPVHRLAGARRRTLLHRFAAVAANRLLALEDPAITASFRAALRVE